MSEDLKQVVLERIGRAGSIRYDDLVELALYHPTLGYYATRDRPGRAGGDFLTSPEVGPLFGRVVAAYLDATWRRLGEPDPYLVVEAGAGRGALAAAVARAEPDCSPALRYVLVDSSPAARAAQSQLVDLEHAANALGPVTPGVAAEIPESAKGHGPVFVSVPDLPSVGGTGVVLANELLDNLPFRVLERTDAGWDEVRIGVDGSDDGRLAEVRIGAHPTLAAKAAALAPAATTGQRIPIQREAVEWLRSARGVLERGSILVIDYGASTAELADRDGGWLRTYRDHQRGTSPLEYLGLQDITADVATDQLTSIIPAHREMTQAALLTENGIDDLVAEGKAIWQANAAAPDLAAMEARSRISEAEALTDPEGLGAFWVGEWRI